METPPPPTGLTPPPAAVAATVPAAEPPLPQWVHDLDARVDRLVDRIRSPRLDPVFYGLSSAADHGLIWFALGSLRAARLGDPRFAARFSAVMGVESALTNGPIKAMFRRVRPVEETVGPLPYGMRRPITSSFPSGHATAAFTAAMMLSAGNKRSAAVWFPLAGLVASSRVYVKMHHASDVVIGAGLGLAFGAIGRKLLAAPSRSSRFPFLP